MPNARTFFFRPDLSATLQDPYAYYHDMQVSLCAFKELSKLETGKQQNTGQPKFRISSFRGDTSNIGDLGFNILLERTGTDVEPRCKHFDPYHTKEDAN
ncbi:hypothetical protein ACVWZK_009120 [Bradyrhizobium sp. GM0.4]